MTKMKEQIELHPTHWREGKTSSNIHSHSLDEASFLLIVPLSAIVIRSLGEKWSPGKPARSSSEQRVTTR